MAWYYYIVFAIFAMAMWDLSQWFGLWIESRRLHITTCFELSKKGLPVYCLLFGKEEVYRSEVEADVLSMREAWLNDDLGKMIAIINPRKNDDTLRQ